MVTGHFSNRRFVPYAFHPLHELNVSLPERFATWTARLVALAPRRSLRHQDVSPPGRFAAWMIRPLNFRLWAFRPVDVNALPFTICPQTYRALVLDDLPPRNNFF